MLCMTRAPLTHNPLAGITSTLDNFGNRRNISPKAPPSRRHTGQSMPQLKTIMSTQNIAIILTLIAASVVITSLAHLVRDTHRKQKRRRWIVVKDDIEKATDSYKKIYP